MKMSRLNFDFTKICNWWEWIFLCWRSTRKHSRLSKLTNTCTTAASFRYSQDNIWITCLQKITIQNSLWLAMMLQALSYGVEDKQIAGLGYLSDHKGKRPIVLCTVLLVHFRGSVWHSSWNPDPICLTKDFLLNEDMIVAMVIAI